MTKEEALLEIDTDVHYYGTTARNRVGEVLDSYSRQMAIAFAEWIVKENKFMIDDQWNQSLSQNVGELYSLFLQHQSQQP